MIRGVLVNSFSNKTLGRITTPTPVRELESHWDKGVNIVLFITITKIDYIDNTPNLYLVNIVIDRVFFMIC